MPSEPIHVRVRLAALWTSVMFLYIYADYFGLFIPGQLQHMTAGQIPPLGTATQGKLMFTSAMMAIPSVMIFLSVAAPRPVSRSLNVTFGLVYSLIILITMWSWAFFIFYGVIEIALTLLAAWYGWKWQSD